MSTQINLKIENFQVQGDQMDFSEIKVGDRVLISIPPANSGVARTVAREGTVTAVHPNTFEAGGLCFRKDGTGTEWWGRYRATFISRKDAYSSVDPGAEDGAASGDDSPMLPFEDVILPFILSSRSESEWLGLGVAELRRIATLFGMQPMEKTGSAERAQMRGFANQQ